MTEEKSRYGERGVSARKSDVHEAVSHLDPGIYPGAFCKILPDVLCDPQDPNFCTIKHSDGAGTKAGLQYLNWLHTGDLSGWRGRAQDSLVMNFDDVGCAGALGPFLVTCILNRNLARIPGEVVRSIIEGTQEFCDFLTDWGIRARVAEVKCYIAGGETADVGDLVRTLTVDHDVVVRYLRSEVIDASRIRPGGIIVGFSSTGQAAWENEPNSGIGSNGLTNARHDTLCPEYREHAETYAPETDRELVYCGKYRLEDPLPGDPRFTIASALLSPTRTYLPLLARLYHEVGRKHFQAMIHCSGGGQTKIGKFGPGGIAYIKENLFPVPPLFRMLQEVRGLSWREMFSSYNMGHRLEAVVPSQNIADDCIAISRECGIDAQVVGAVHQGGKGATARMVHITTPEGIVENYSFSNH